MAFVQNLPTLLIFPRRAKGMLMAVLAAIGLSVAIGGLLARLLGGEWASLSTLFYLAVLLGCAITFRAAWREILASMEPLIELNSEEIIVFSTGLRIPWASIVDIAQRRVNGRWVIVITHLAEESVDDVETTELPLTGYNMSGRRVGVEIRRRFAQVDALDPGPELENPAIAG